MRRCAVWSVPPLVAYNNRALFQRCSSNNDTKVNVSTKFWVYTLAMLKPVCPYTKGKHAMQSRYWAVTSGNVPSEMCAQRRFRSDCACSLCAVWSESSLGAFRIASDAKFPHLDTDNSNHGSLSLLSAHVRRFLFSSCGSNLVVLPHYTSINAYFPDIKPPCPP